MAHIKLEYKSQALLRGVTVDVILPSDAIGLGLEKETPRPYKTLYFLPGYSADSEEIITYLGMRKQAELKGIAVVTVNGENSFYVDQPNLNNNFSRFVGQEIVEVTRNFFPLSAKREDTFIGGISMGGYGAVLNGLRYSDTFSKIAVLSPAIDAYDIMVQDPLSGFSEKMFESFFGSKEAYYAGDTNLEKALLENKKKSDVFIGCGSSDIAVYRAVKRYVNHMKGKEVSLKYKEVEGNHDLDTWNRLLDAAFSFLAGIEEGTKDELAL